MAGRRAWTADRSRDSGERSFATLTAGFMALLVIYASLYPFEGWQWPAGLDWRTAWQLPWPRWRDRADEWLNVLGYVPVGFLMTLALMRRGWSVFFALLVGIIAAAVLSYCMEIMQTLLPRRVPSLRDWVGNTTGAAMGSVLALLMHFMGWLQRMRRWRDRWFTRDSAGALVLLLLWPAALLAPSTLPFGLGQCWDEIQGLVLTLIRHLPLQHLGWSLELAAPAANPRGLPSAPAQMLAIALGALAPVALCSAALAPGLRRAVPMVVVAVVAFAGMTLSTALNFGPPHAWSWLTPTAVLACLLVLPLAVPFLLLSRRWCAVLGLLVLAVAVALGAQMPSGAYHELNLQSWEQGRFIRFHGLSLWVAWLWPYMTMVWLMMHLTERHPTLPTIR
jgi:VanZ family protein